MHKLYELKEMLCKELEEYGTKEKLDVGGLEIVDKLSHAIKNIDKIIEKYDEEGYSMAGGSYARGGIGGVRGGRGRRSYAGVSYGGESYGEYDDGTYSGESYARGRGRNARRDSMGRYSSAEDEVIMTLKEFMMDSRDDRTRKEFEHFIKKLENM